MAKLMKFNGVWKDIGSMLDSDHGQRHAYSKPTDEENGIELSESRRRKWSLFNDSVKKEESDKQTG